MCIFRHSICQHGYFNFHSAYQNRASAVWILLVKISSASCLFMQSGVVWYAAVCVLGLLNYPMFLLSIRNKKSLFTQFKQIIKGDGILHAVSKLLRTFAACCEPTAKVSVGKYFSIQDFFFHSTAISR